MIRISLVFHGEILEIKNVKNIQIRRSRFDYESESEYYLSCKNHESESEYSGFGGKDSNLNLNLNICYKTVSQLRHYTKWLLTHMK